MAETLLQFQTAITGPDGTRYEARACGAETESGTWQGWIEFVPIGGGDPVRSPRETTQPNRTDTEYWASGLTPVYLEGALQRALNPLMVPLPPAPEPPRFDTPAPSPILFDSNETGGSAVLDPFSVYQKGEELLRKQLGALSAWHLVNIAVQYDLTREDRATLARMSAPVLVDRIVDGVRAGKARSAVRSRRTR
jgi:hypothetical protein